ncbi:uncharacterized protein PHALS_05999 [Plasmopara halstedii]|uniref:Uncharacterized protein n=1 Tax=Plasmopara halstedii TaxID=4781 RepID=A0A0P1AAV1_PLAHL|nr:uncharacterized protein PHALS_05999 [Plasmopara halstedii]CEG37954.1 hypothetical protein PHALS_05999 [Plasmopara halstedii]|eukprot:XP_024574323.1 hypothetical protein PHALS_05999 [Plasmopara halstedii]
MTFLSVPYLQMDEVVPSDCKIGHQMSKATDSLRGKVCRVEVTLTQQCLLFGWNPLDSKRIINVFVTTIINFRLLLHRVSTLGFQRRNHSRSRSPSPDPFVQSAR